MRNKYIFLLTLTFGLMANVSCTKFLDTQPDDFLSPVNYYETEQQLNNALAGVYDNLGVAYGGVYLYRLGIEADEGYYAKTTPTNGPQLYDFASSHPDILNFWANYYSGIYRANVLLANVDKNKSISEAYRNKVRGEAMFLRGYYYFMLVQSFGGVPLITTPTLSPNDVIVPRATAKEIYDQVLADMKGAEALVPTITSLGFGGRVNKSAVRGILARVCLYMAGAPLKDVSKYAEARDWAKKVMDDGEAAHALNANYSQVFINLAQDKYDVKESIWEVEYYGNDAEAFKEAGWLGYVNGPSTSNAATGAGYGGIRATARLYGKFADGDLRRDWSIANFNYTNAGANGAKTMLTDVSVAGLYNRFCGKYRREYEVVLPKTSSKTPQNFPVLRYADVLLMFAEAENEVNNAPTAAAYNAINLVRKRGFGKLVAGASNVNAHDLANLDHDSFKDQLQNERTRELAFEQLRKPDLIRWGLFVSTMNGVGAELNSAVPNAYYRGTYLNVTTKHLIWPIPNSEMTLNSALTQNPNW